MSRPDTSACVHCGLCLNVCPTYQETGIESESPRGRVYLLQAIARDPALLTAESLRHIDDCLDCRACEEACPAHVPVGHMVESFRRDREGPRLAVPIRRFLTGPSGLRWFQRLARGSRVRPVRSALAWAPRWIPQAALDLGAGLPARLPAGLGRDRLGRRFAARGEDGVMLFLGCVMDSVYAAVNEQTAALLVLAGSTVVVPLDQRCCGALSAHSGDVAGARRLARINIEAFEASGAQWVVVNAAGCGAELREYPDLFAPSDPWRGRAEALADRVIDIHVCLDRHPLPVRPPNGRRVTVHDACHLAHAQGVREPVRAVLRRAGFEVVEMAAADRCCGSAGVYNLTHPEMSARLQTLKVRDIPSRVEAVATGNPGCLLQIQAGVRKVGRDVRVLHTVELLYEVYAPDLPAAAGVRDEP